MRYIFTEHCIAIGKVMLQHNCPEKADLPHPCDRQQVGRGRGSPTLVSQPPLPALPIREARLIRAFSQRH